MEQNPIYSKIEYNEALFSKKLILMAEMEILRSIEIMSNYKELRKQELMLKLKLKNNLSEIKNNINKIIENSPKTEGINKKIKIKKNNSTETKIKKIDKRIHIGNQLTDIKSRLEALGH
ncbi:MAG TPA: hypothetical protein P5277_04190 [Candidatus Paceibacterota bacterium]|nr:hypothetical protein [Candidatus Paceibacterota bacterium]